MEHSTRQAIRAGHVFDGVQADGPGMVLIEDGVIQDVDFSGAAAPEDAAVTDFGPDAWVLPGLIDAHVHLCWDATAHAVDHVTTGTREQLLETARTAAATALQVGVTTVRDLGDRDYLTLALREQIPATERPEIVAAGPPLTIQSGHCHFLGGVAEGTDALREAVRERAERGCDVVKVMASGGNMTPGSSPLSRQYSPKDLRLIVEEAQRYGLGTAAHVHAADVIGDVLDAGFDTLEHFSFLTADGVGLRRDLLDQVIQRGTFVSLTLGHLPGGTVPPAIAARIEALKQAMAEIVTSGARVVLGTDAGIEPIKPHSIYPNALAQLGGFGMPALGVLRSATSVAADAVGLAGRKGVLRAGADADLVVLGSSPLDNLSAFTDIRAVYRVGQQAPKAA